MFNIKGFYEKIILYYVYSLIYNYNSLIILATDCRTKFTTSMEYCSIEIL